MKTRQKLGIAMAASIGLGLGACGGSDDTPAVTSQVPSSASASVSGYNAYVVALARTSPDNLEPVDISAVTPPTSDTTEPDPVN
jgi:hypothetical protein